MCKWLRKRKRFVIFLPAFKNIVFFTMWTHYQLLDSIKIQYFDLPKLSANVTKKDNLFPEYYYTIAYAMNF
ncbi:MAG: hypothetical protein H7A23_08945 [Leptospiraceae bacterium]|nr:hypothetical protein [Leptospiraceae bacterium]MCP5494669.1 hypothetical protein [Leptospiraceae bacterium]